MLPNEKRSEWKKGGMDEGQKSATGISMGMVAPWHFLCRRNSSRIAVPAVPIESIGRKLERANGLEGLDCKLLCISDV